MMARFRLRDHHTWRQGPPEPEPPGRRVTRAATPRRAPTEPPADERRIDEIGGAVRSLGPLAWPAVAYDRLFGGWHGRGATFFAARFLLVVVAIALLAGGVSGDAPIIYRTGEYQSVTPASVVDTYVTKSHVHIYPLAVGRSPTSSVGATFDDADGDVRVPTFQDDEAKYGLQVRLVRQDPTIRPVLLLSTPGESHRTVTPVSDDSVVVRFPTLWLDEPGKWELIVHSTEGIGHVEMHLSVAKADVDAIVAPQIGWWQAGIGLLMLTVLLGAYTPGAALLRERRHLERRAEDRAWNDAPPDGVPDDATGFARMHPRRQGTLPWRRPGKDAAEGLAELPGRGWVIRLD